MRAACGGVRCLSGLVNKAQASPQLLLLQVWKSATPRTASLIQGGSRSTAEPLMRATRSGRVPTGVAEGTVRA